MATDSPTQRRGSLDLDRVSGSASRIRRFNGLTRRTSDWDGLRKDSQLWFSGADCLVHFYAYRASQRGPSLRLPFQAVKELDCEYLSNFCLRTHNRLSPIASEDGHSDSGYGSELERTEYELYIPAPSSLSREQAFEYHLATRNLLAYAVGRPVVGQRLSTALSGVWQRMQDWDPQACSLDTFKSYCKTQGYFDLAENPEHALAMLNFADDARLRDIWIEAFVHCVGMHQRLESSPEWSGLSNTTVALITRASLEMDLHITRVVRALGGFLEEELGAERLGLSRHARDHLDRFRSFLHAFYVDKLGYFPPKQKKAWNKRAWSRVHHDFQCLHDYLVDQESSFDLNGTRSATGGVCVVQNLSAFDQRHGYEPLPHPLPLLPSAPPKSRRGVSSQRGLRTLSLGMSASAPDVLATKRQVLEKASNNRSQDVMACNMVQEYQRFERQRLEEKLELGEARKVRWILIYAVLQMLNSIMKAPTEIVDTREVSYALCSLTTGCPPWKDDTPPAESVIEPDQEMLVASNRSSLIPDALENLEGRTSRISIHPDCEAENAEQFFASIGNISRQPSQVDLSATPAPLRINTQLNRRASIIESMQSSVTTLHKSVFGSLNRRTSSRRSSIAPTPVSEPKKMPSFREIVVEGYGNGLELGNGLVDEPADMDADDYEITPSQQTGTNDFALFDFGLAPSNDEPTLEFHELAEPEYEEEMYVDHPDLVDVSPRDSHTSEDFALYRISSNGSFGDPGTPVTEPESEEETECDDDSTLTEQVEEDLYMHPQGSGLMRLNLHSYIPSKINAGSNTSVNAGCYMPTGMLEPPTSRFSHTRQSASISSMLSTASSIYPEQPVQADDIEEEDVRGRRRSRALDGVGRFGAAATTGVAAKKSLPIIGLVIAAMLITVAIHLISNNASARHSSTTLDDEKAMSLEMSDEKTGYRMDEPALDDWAPAHFDPVFDLDDKAAEAQLLSEFDASLISERTGHATKQPVELLDTDTVLYVNAKQYDRIMKRRVARQRLEDSLRLLSVRVAEKAMADRQARVVRRAMVRAA